MKSPKSPSIFLSGKSWPLFHGLASLFILLIMGLQLSPLSSYIETRMTSPLYFQARHKLHKSPSLSPKLKIIALDDSSFSYLGGPRLSHKQLVSLLRQIGDRAPRAIILDSLLSDTPDDILASLPEDLRKLPIYSGNFPSQLALRYRNPLDLGAEAYQAKTYLRGVSSLRDLSYAVDQRKGWYVYGNSPSYQALIRATGHITFNRDGTISPFYQVDEESVLPHISLFTSHSVELRADGLWLEGTRAPLTQKGSLLINHRPPDELYRITWPLRGTLQRAAAQEPEQAIEAGDVVLVLLAFATGNTDFHEGSPFGEIPGGLLIASMISDILEHTWLTKIELDIPLIFVFGLAGIILGINARASRYWFALIGAWVLWSSLTITCFSYLDTWLPWLLPLLAFSGSSLIHFAHVRVQDELRLILIERNYFEEKALRLEEMQKKAELESNLSLGYAVQKLLLPKELHGRFASFHYELRYKPVTNLSGDWLYIWDFSPQERRIFIGDVMGTGPSAAIPMACLVGILKDCEELRLSLEQSIARLNQRLFELFDQHVVCSLSAIALHSSGEIEVFNAGGPGWVVAAAQASDFHPLRSQPIGMQAGLTIAHERFVLRENELAFSFTDGFVRESKDLRRLIRHLRQQKRRPSRAQEVESALQLVLQVNQTTDDQSILCVWRDPIQVKKSSSY